MIKTDVILVGGGLANGLIAWWLHTCHPETQITIIEQGALLGGEHTWSFYASDLTPIQRDIIDPLIAARWEGYEVHFPAYSRFMRTPYASITSASLHEALTATSLNIRLRTPAEIIAPDRVELATGEVLSAPLIIDGRGWQPTSHYALAYQKFVGIELRTRQAHGQSHPVIMDATVPQADGYRFFYLLPFAADRILVEDTRYSATAAVDIVSLRQEIEQYVQSKGWEIAEKVREESGVLPITLAGHFHKFWSEKLHTVVGLRAGLFHPTTGYSLPDAVRLAEAIAELPVRDNAQVQLKVRTIAARQWRSQAFFRLLNRMLFLAAAPAMRYKVLERFYRFAPARIERFYAGSLTWADCMALLIGKPPVSVMKAIASLSQASAWKKETRGDG